MTPEQMAALATESLFAGCGFVTFILPHGKKAPKGFPRGELLCVVNRDGESLRAYSYDAAKVIKWLRKSNLVNVTVQQISK
jgi:hypothetical protein